MKLALAILLLTITSSAFAKSVAFFRPEAEFSTSYSFGTQLGAFDYRVPILSENFRYVGRLMIQGGPFQLCSAVLIHPKYVLTNRHCVWGVGSVEFIIDPADPTQVGKAIKGKNFFYAPGYDEKKDVHIEQWASSYFGFDMAIVELETPVLEVRPVKIASDSSSDQLKKLKYTSVGYPSMLYNRQTPRRQGTLLNCKFIELFEDLLFDTACEATIGQSGGALLAENSVTGEWELIGLTTIMMEAPVTHPWVRSVYLPSRIEWINKIINSH